MLQVHGRAEIGVAFHLPTAASSFKLSLVLSGQALLFMAYVFIYFLLFYKTEKFVDNSWIKFRLVP